MKLGIGWQAALGGLIFVLVFAIQYDRIPDDFYVVRDDGVITMSHARNWVDYGVIGVNPSGERVEGYSAPFQFFACALLYATTHLDYRDFAILQTWLATFLLGALFCLLIHRVQGGWARREPELEGQPRWWVPCVLTVAAAIMLTRLTSFFQWHGSGLENAITHSLFLATIWTLYRGLTGAGLPTLLVLVPFAASISRVESVFHLAPILCVFVVLWAVQVRSWRGPLFVLGWFVLFAVFHGWRWIYFGDLLPNTAHAQAIYLGDMLSLLVHLEPKYLALSNQRGLDLLAAHGGHVLLPFLCLLPFMAAATRRISFLLTCSLLLLLTAYMNPFIFGKTTLDPTRSTTQAAVAVVLGAVAILAALPRKRVLWVAVPLALVGAAILHQRTWVDRYSTCCSVEPFEKVRLTWLEIAERERLPRPTAANPDLGAVSWHKQFNVIDLGRLGSPLLSEFREGPLLNEYLLDLAQPDLIELHGAWSRSYVPLLRDPRFRERYVRMRPDVFAAGSVGPDNPDAGVWARIDILDGAPTPERRLIDDLSADLSIERIRTEYDRLFEARAIAGSSADTMGIGGTPLGGGYIARTVYRFLPEWTEAGLVEELLEEMERRGASPFDLYLIEGRTDGQAYHRAADFIMDHYLERRIGERPPLVEGVFDAYVVGQDVILYKEPSTSDDVLDPFYLRVFPENSVPPGRFDQTAFLFSPLGNQVGDRAILVQRLPPYPIASIQLGQFEPGVGPLWEVAADLPHTGP